MDEAAFWKIVAKSLETLSETSLVQPARDTQVQALTHALRSLPLKDVIAFQRAFSLLMAQANRWDLMRIALLIEGCCGDDGFREFRYWLVSRGKVDFYDVLEHPDCLAEMAHRNGSEVTFFPEFGTVAQDVYEERTGSDSPPSYDISFLRQKPGGEKFEPTPQEFQERFPKLWKRFGDHC